MTVSLLGIGGALGLGASRIAKAMAESVRGAVKPERVVAIGEPLARALDGEGLRVFAVVDSARRRKKGPPRLIAAPSALPFGPGAFDALCAAGVPEDPAACRDALREYARVVRPGGLVCVATAASALVRRVAPPEALAGACVHARLVDVEQRLLGGTLVTSARVRAWPHLD